MDADMFNSLQLLMHMFYVYVDSFIKKYKYYITARYQKPNL